MNLFAAYCNNH